MSAPRSRHLFLLAGGLLLLLLIILRVVAWQVDKYAAPQVDSPIIASDGLFYFLTLYGWASATTLLGLGYLVVPFPHLLHQVCRFGLAVSMLVLVLTLLLSGVVIEGALTNDDVREGFYAELLLYLLPPILYTLLVGVGSRWLARRRAA